MVNKDSHGITVCGPHIHIDEGINTSRVESVGRQKSNPWHSVRSHHVLHHFIHNTARIGAQLFGSGARNTLLLLVLIKYLKSQISGTCTGFFRHKRLKPRKCANWCQSIRVCSDKITYGLHQAKNGHSDVWVLQTMDPVLKLIILPFWELLKQGPQLGTPSQVPTAVIRSRRKKKHQDLRRAEGNY